MSYLWLPLLSALPEKRVLKMKRLYPLVATRKTAHTDTAYLSIEANMKIDVATKIIRLQRNENNEKIPKRKIRYDSKFYSKTFRL